MPGAPGGRRKCSNKYKIDCFITVFQRIWAISAARGFFQEALGPRDAPDGSLKSPGSPSIPGRPKVSPTTENSTCCFGQQIAPKEAFGTKKSAFDAELFEESENAIESFPKSLKLGFEKSKNSDTLGRTGILGDPGLFRQRSGASWGPRAS